MYIVYKWDKDDIENYNETYGDESFNDDIEKPSCFGSVSQFGSVVKETNDLDEANRLADKAQDEVGYYGVVAIWDFNEKEWFN